MVRALVDTTRAEQGYDRVLLLDLGLRAIYATPREGPAPDARARALGARAMERREVVFLNTTRRRNAAALRLAFPITRTQVPAVKAVRGEVGVVTGVDYSGTVVMAAVGPVPGTPWFLVSKVDISEIDAPLRSLMQWTVFVVLGIILLGGAVMLVFWSRRCGR